MSAISKTKTRVKAGVTEITQKPTRAIVHFGLGFAVGAIVDMILALIYRQIAPEWEEIAGKRSPLPFYYYRYPPEEHEWAATAAWDDFFLVIITIGMLVLGWFKKGLLFTLGFFLGWYVSTNEELLTKFQDLFKNIGV